MIDSFKFVVSPLMNPASPCLYDASLPVPWTDVVQVILTVTPADRNSDVSASTGIDNDDAETGVSAMGSLGFGVDESEAIKCPICLDCICVPRITSCGHIYW